MLVIFAKTEMYGPVIGKILEADNQEQAIELAVKMAMENNPSSKEQEVRTEIEADLAYGDCDNWSVSICTVG